MKTSLGILLALSLMANILLCCVVFKPKETYREPVVLSGISITQPVMEIPGVYQCELPYQIAKLDLRSDGTGRLDKPGSGIIGLNIQWREQPAGNVSIPKLGDFRIEGMDLIDSKGNRWSKER